MNNKVVYAHKRKSDDQTFYIGIGEPSRPYYVHARSNFWNNYTNKHDWYVEILAENLKWDEACEMEIKLIEKYGRRDKGEGPLLNQTKGGDGVIDRVISDEQRKKLSEATKRRWESMNDEQKEAYRENLRKYQGLPRLNTHVRNTLSASIPKNGRRELRNIYYQRSSAGSGAMNAGKSMEN